MTETGVLRAVLLAGVRRLQTGEIDGAARDARLLLAAAAGIDAGRISLEPDWPISPSAQATFDAMIDRRLAHEPVSRIIGMRAFWGRDFVISGAVLDPRPDTETLIDIAINTQHIHTPNRILDLGTGSGIVAITLLARWPNAQATATDIDAECLVIAENNGARHGVNDRLTLCVSDWFAAIKGRYDLIVSNPPYITDDEMADLSPDVFDYDPHLALTPGGDGLGPYRVIAANAPAYLAPGGWVMVEIGPTQGDAVEALFHAAQLVHVATHRDFDGRARVVIGQMPAGTA